MGSFFTNVQVHARRLDSKARDGVSGVLRSLLSDEGFVPADGGAADRTILVDAGDDWISVYDEATEEQDQKVLDRLALGLSRLLDTEALAVLVHDSDVLELRLFRSGEAVDRFNSNPSYFGKVSAAERKAARGNADLWAPVLSATVDAARLRAAWKAETAFAEETLDRVAEVVGLDRTRASTGFKHAEHEDPRYAKLAFRRAGRPERAPPAEEPPCFTSGTLVSTVDISVGSSRAIDWSVQNAGGPSRGVSVVVWGDALDRGLLSADSVTILAGDPRSPDGRASLPLGDEDGIDGQKLRIASFAGLPVPSGKGGSDGRGGTSRTLSARILASRIHVEIQVTGLAGGAEKFHVGFLPAANRQGSHSYTALARVNPRPLRSPADAPEDALRRLEGRGLLFALVSMDLDPATAADVATQEIERWRQLFDPSGRWEIALGRAEGGARPKNETVKAKTLFGGARWKKLQEQLRTEQVVAATHLQEDEPPGYGKDGFTFGRGASRVGAPDDPDLPTLGLWLNAKAAGAPRIEEASKAATEAMDRIMAHHRGVQALVGRWNWEPELSPDVTPYEAACGVGGRCTLRRSWLSRYLRGVAPGMLWLGPSLAARVPDLAHREAAAQVTSMGDGLRIKVERYAALHDVEASLAPVLPSREDWEREVGRLDGT